MNLVEVADTVMVYVAGNFHHDCARYFHHDCARSVHVELLCGDVNLGSVHVELLCGDVNLGSVHVELLCGGVNLSLCMHTHTHRLGRCEV